MRYLIGNDTYINFWDDKWIEGITLRIAFPRIFAFAINKSGKVCEFGLKVNGVWQWQVDHRIRVFDWETDSWELFNDCLNSIVLN